MSGLIEPRGHHEHQALVRFPVASEPWTGESEPEGHRLTLPYYWFLIRRQRWRIITFVLVTTAIVSLGTLALPKQYDATAMLRVDPQASRVVGENDPAQNGAPVDATLLVSTEADVVTSPAVVLETIRNLGLGANPEFAPPSSDPSDLSQTARTDRLLRTVTKRISIDQPIGTLLLNIHFRSHNPQLSADVANGLANAFLEHEYATRAKALSDSSKYMADQLDGLRAQMEQDETALVDYESNNDVIDPDDKENIYESRLSQINQDYTRVQAQRMQLQADYDIVESGDLDALLTSQRGQSLLPLQARLIADQRDLSRMGAIYGPRHPLYLQQEELVEHDRAVLTDQEQHVAQQVRDEYRAAAGDEALLAAALSRQKAAMDAFNLRAVRYHILKAKADSSQKLYYSLQEHIQDANVAAGLHSEDLRVISPARPEDKPVWPRPLLTGFLALVLSSVLGVGVTLAAGLWDRTLSSPEEAEMRLGVSAVGLLPLISLKDNPGALEVAQYSAALLPAESAPAESEALRQRSPFREAILSLHSTIQFASAERLVVLAVSSSVPGEGKSTTTAHLAGAFASMGTRVVLVDADMRKPNVHRLFGVDNRTGLSSVLRHLASLESALTPAFGGLSLLPAGPVVAAPSELLHLGLAEVIAQLRDRFEVVLIDCPPILGFADASAVANLADGVLLVVAAGATDQRQVRASLRQLRAARANILGVVLNRVSERTDSYYNYYGSYYGGYYYRSDEETEEAHAES